MIPRHCSLRVASILGMLGLSLAAASSALAQSATSQPSSTQPGSRPRRPAPPPASPQDIARLAEQGKANAFAHDPSTIVRCGDDYWMFCTGEGIPNWHSKDLRTWTPGPPVLRERPAWLERAVPLHRRMGFWAPDVVKLAEDRYLLFYSASTFGKQTSAIAVASNRTLDPNDPNYAWQEDGIVVQSNERENFNAIDPAILHDDDGKLWMVFGSYWSGIKLIELNPSTGKRLHPETKPIAVANKREGIEAAFLAKHDGKYVLFVNWGTCCQGVRSTYEIRVGRSDKIEGPYLDREGKPLLEGGGSPVLASDGKFIGPGHAGIVVDAAGKQWLSCHFYDGTENGAPHLALRPLTWTQDGWPLVGEVK